MITMISRKIRGRGGYRIMKHTVKPLTKQSAPPYSPNPIFRAHVWLAAAQLTFSVTVTLRRLRVEKPEEQSVSVGELGQECVSSRVC